ncbi:class F sortase [Jeotgalibacillus proteolyticus]|uniref:Class F sortase n=1 Tax=Jeotgalibacillus proteolyticus TaxID=2082395 RepID=A0A2S5GAR9_9BACL|nr:class F sortase [Jeotgalibacillus proteolyticus]PPA70127.1 class F sortase [Jeotgalibacillus proteolyticus]
MKKTILLSMLTGLIVFIIGYGAIVAAENWGEPEASINSEETVEADALPSPDAEGDEMLGSVENQKAGDSKEEFPILERDRERFEKLLAEQTPETASITPAAISIPALNIEAPIIEMGILDDGAMEVPENVDEVGWFKPGIKPGDVGNAVLAGHVDSYDGPAIFFELRSLEPGDEIIVTAEDGEALTFSVKALESYPTDGAPIKEIFGPSSSKGLNLITCTGSFNRETGQYPDRLVVYTELVEEEAEEIEYIPYPPSHVEITGKQLSWHAVRDAEIVGYRTYKELEDGTKEQVSSVSYYERKSITIDDPGASYHITSVSIDGKESEAAAPGSE